MENLSNTTASGRSIGRSIKEIGRRVGCGLLEGYISHGWDTDEFLVIAWENGI